MAVTPDPVNAPDLLEAASELADAHVFTVDQFAEALRLCVDGGVPLTEAVDLCRHEANLARADLIHDVFTRSPFDPRRTEFDPRPDPPLRPAL